MAPTVQTESAKLNLQADKTYNIHVKAIRSDNYSVQSDWSDTLTVDSRNLGEFWYMIFGSCTTGTPNPVWEFLVVSYCVILKMAVIIKDLYGNSGNRFNEINSRWDFPI